jgi:RNA polymerase sigma-B factor
MPVDAQGDLSPETLDLAFPPDLAFPSSSAPRQAKRTGLVTTEAGAHVLLNHYARTRCGRTREAIIAHYRGLVRALAFRFSSPSEGLDDLVQVGTIGLIQAVDRYDPARAVPFPVYAAPSIVGEIKHHFRDRTWSVRVPRSLQDRLLLARKTEAALSARLGRNATIAEIAQEMSLPEEDVLEAMETGRNTRAASLDRPLRGEEGGGEMTLNDRVGSWDSGMHEWEAYADLTRALSCLNARDREILRLRFWEEQSQTQVAERLGMSQMHVSRLQVRALARLKGKLAE